MKLEGQNCQTVRQAIKNKQGVEFEADKSITAFSGNEAPSDWAAYPPSVLNEADLAKVKGILATDTSLRAALHRVEQAAHDQGAKVYYKKLDDDTVSIKIQW